MHWRGEFPLKVIKDEDLWLPFSKMSADGNDFIILDPSSMDQRIFLVPELIRKLTSRLDGVGADQLIFFAAIASDAPVFNYRVFNCDGVEAAQCINGSRCLAQYLIERNFVESGVDIQFKTKSHYHLKARFLEEDGFFETIVSCPSHDLSGKTKISTPYQEAYFKLSNNHLMDFEKVEHFEISQPETHLIAGLFYLGNPHAICEVSLLDSIDLEDWGNKMQDHRLFPEQINLSAIEMLDDRCIAIQTFERGVGKTRACGSAICSATYLMFLTGRLKQREILTIQTEESKLYAYVEGRHIYLKGQSTWYFDGLFFDYMPAD